MTTTTGPDKRAQKTASRQAPAVDRRPKRARTRSNIYRAAMDLFHEESYDTVTIEDICGRAGIAKATFFLHFPNKSALLGAFNEELAANIRTLLQDTQGSPADKLHLITAELSSAWQKDADIMRKMVRELVDQLPVVKEDHASNTHLIELMGEVIEEGQEIGMFQPRPPAHRIAAAMVAASSAVTLEWSQDPAIDTHKAHMDLLSLHLNGLIK